MLFKNLQFGEILLLPVYDSVVVFLRDGRGRVVSHCCLQIDCLLRFYFIERAFEFQDGVQKSERIPAGSLVTARASASLIRAFCPLRKSAKIMPRSKRCLPPPS